MGKLLKLALSRNRGTEHHTIGQRLRGLFRKFVKLTNSNSSLSSSPIVISYPNLSFAPAAKDREESPSIPASTVTENSPNNVTVSDKAANDDEASQPSAITPCSPSPNKEVHKSPLDTAMCYDDTMVETFVCVLFCSRMSNSHILFGFFLSS